MLKDSPDHHDAELVLKLYELRREPTMRESRSAINGKFAPASYEEFVAITKRDHPLNAAYRQVGTYWEMAYGLIKHGVLNADLAMESNGEGLLLYVKAEPYLERLRAEVNPRSFLNSGWVVSNTEAGRRVHAAFVERARREAAARK
jgi:hypothetical protein